MQNRPRAEPPTSRDERSREEGPEAQEPWLEENLIQMNGSETAYWLSFPDHDVKNRVALEFVLREPLAALIAEYVRDHLPVLARGSNDPWLFPGRENGRHKQSGVLREQITAVVKKHCGLRLTPHQFRHAAGTLILNTHPGNYELARRVLGHRSVRTTVQSYCGLETTQATAIFGDIVRDKLRDQSAGASLMLRDLPLEQWPDADLQGWETALQPARRLSVGGRAAHRGPYNKANLERGYGYFLRVVSESGALSGMRPPHPMSRPKAIEIFVERAELSRNSLSIASGVERVRAVAQFLAPETNFGWLKNVAAQRGRGTAAANVFAHGRQREIVEAGLVLMQEARGARTRHGASEDVS